MVGFALAALVACCTGCLLASGPCCERSTCRCSSPSRTSSCTRARGAAIRSSTSWSAAPASRSSSAAPTGSRCAPSSGVEGWARSRTCRRRVLADGAQLVFNDWVDRAGFTDHRWEAGLFWPATTAAPASFRSTARSPSIRSSRLELSLGALPGQVLQRLPRRLSGSCTSSYPSGAASPFFMLGTGVVHIEPKATLVQPDDRTDQIGLRGRRRALLPHAPLLPARRIQRPRRVHQPQRQRGSGRMETRLRVFLLTVAAGLRCRAARRAHWFRHGHCRCRSPRRRQASADGRCTRRRGSSSRRSSGARSRSPKIDSRELRAGLATGILWIEDFGTNPVYGVQLRLPHHRGLLLPGRVRPLQGGAHQLRDPERQRRSCLPTLRDASRTTTCPSATTSCLARSFLGRDHAMTSAFTSSVASARPSSAATRSSPSISAPATGCCRRTGLRCTSTCRIACSTPTCWVRQARPTTSRRTSA